MSLQITIRRVGTAMTIRRNVRVAKNWYFFSSFGDEVAYRRDDQISAGRNKINIMNNTEAEIEPFSAKSPDGNAAAYSITQYKQIIVNAARTSNNINKQCENLLQFLSPVFVTEISSGIAIFE